MGQINKIMGRASIPHPTDGKVREGLLAPGAKGLSRALASQDTPPGTAAGAGFARCDFSFFSEVASRFTFQLYPLLPLELAQHNLYLSPQIGRP